MSTPRTPRTGSTGEVTCRITFKEAYGQDETLQMAVSLISGLRNLITHAALMGDYFPDDDEANYDWQRIELADSVKVVSVSYNSPWEIVLTTGPGPCVATAISVLSALPGIVRRFSRLRVQITQDSLEEEQLQLCGDRIGDLTCVAKHGFDDDERIQRGHSSPSRVQMSATHFTVIES